MCNTMKLLIFNTKKLASAIKLEYVVLFGVTAVFLSSISSNTIACLDMFHEMALFREWVRSGIFPKDNPFSYTPSVYPVVHHEWGTGVLLYIATVWSGLGGTGLMVLKYVLTMFIAVSCYLLAKRDGTSMEIFLPLAFLATILGRIGFTTIRAQLLSLAFLAVLLYCMQEDRSGRRWWVALWLPVYVVWLNLHAGFLAGYGTFFLFVVERTVSTAVQQQSLRIAYRQVNHLLLVLVIMSVLVCANPYGFDYVTYLVHALSIDRTPFIMEWRPLWRLGEGIYPYFFLAVYCVYIAIAAYSLWHKDFYQYPGVLVLFVTAILALCQVRHLSIYCMVWVSFVPAYVQKTPLGDALRRLWNRQKKFLIAFWLIVGVLATIHAASNQFWKLCIPTVKQIGNKTNVLIYPVGPIAYLSSQKFCGNLMTHFNDGSYASWKLHPHVKVSMDSRFEVAYPYRLVVENFNFYNAERGWEKILCQYATDAVLVPHHTKLSEVIAGAVEKDKGILREDWVKTYIDDSYSLYIKRSLHSGLRFVDRRGEVLQGTFP